MLKAKRKLQALVMSSVLVVGTVVPATATTTATSTTFSGSDIVASTDQETDKKSTFNSTLKILEIQPGNSYILNDNEATKKALQTTFGVQEVIVECMPVTLFNAERTELNGQYDIIYLGKGTGSHFNEEGKSGKGATYKYEEKYGPLDAKKGKIDSKFIYGGSQETQVETFSPIDMTALKANQIIAQANDGQMVIVEEALGDVADSQIKVLADALLGKPNVAVVNGLQTATIETTLQQAGITYQTETIKKRPYLNIKKDSDEAGERHLGFNVQAYNHNSIIGDMNINVYVDANGNGHFEDEEFVSKSQVENLTNDEAYSSVGVGLQIPEDYAGYLGYKIEVQDTTTGICNYVTYVEEYLSETPQVIRVLQLLPNKDATFDILENEDFVKLYESSATTPTSLKNYKFEVEVQTVQEFVAQYPQDNVNTRPVYEIIEEQRKAGTLESFLNEAGKDSKLNGQYDMIMMGFRDNYEHISNNAAIIDLMYFMQTGQSVMFTHDAMGLAKSNEKIIMPDYIMPEDFKKLTQEQKDEINKAIENETKWKEDYGKEMTLAMREFVGQGTYRPEAETDKYDYVNYLVNGLKVGQNTTTKVRKINDGQITAYPYPIDLVTPVAKTHHQWYELDLEDPEIDVWYTLTDGVYNWYDPVQSYYTYSKGNITYSGTGHSGGYPLEEQKMFVNTMVKAASAANHAPEVEVSDIVEDQMIDYREDRPFKIKITDIDILDDMANYEVYVYGEQQAPEEDAPDGTVPDKAELVAKGKATIGQDKEITLTKETLSKILTKKNNKVVDNQTFTLVIKAVDDSGAEKTLEMPLRAGKPAVEVSYTWDQPGYLVGDRAIVTVNIDIANSDDVSNEQVVLAYTDDTSSDTIETITSFKDGNFNKQYTVDLTGVSKNELNAAISYNFDGDDKTDAYTESVPTVKGMITVNVVDELDTPAEGVELKITAPDGTVTTEIVPGSGIVTIDNCISGEYKVEIGAKDGILFNETVQTATLAYHATDTTQYEKTIEFKALDSQKPTIITDHTPKGKTLSAVDILARLDGTGSNIVEATYLPGQHDVNTIRDHEDAVNLTLLPTPPTDEGYGEAVKNEPTGTHFVDWAEFTVTTNGYYTIYTKDQSGKEEIVHVNITNIETLTTDIT